MHPALVLQQLVGEDSPPPTAAPARAATSCFASEGAPVPARTTRKTEGRNGHAVAEFGPLSADVARRFPKNPSSPDGEIHLDFEKATCALPRENRPTPLHPQFIRFGKSGDSTGRTPPVHRSPRRKGESSFHPAAGSENSDRTGQRLLRTEGIAARRQ